MADRGRERAQNADQAAYIGLYMVGIYWLPRVVTETSYQKSLNIGGEKFAENSLEVPQDFPDNLQSKQ